MTAPPSSAIYYFTSSDKLIVSIYWCHLTILFHFKSVKYFHVIFLSICDIIKIYFKFYFRKQYQSLKILMHSYCYDINGLSQQTIVLLTSSLSVFNILLFHSQCHDDPSFFTSILCKNNLLTIMFYFKRFEKKITMKLIF